MPAHEPLLAPYRRDDLRTTTFGEPGGDVRCLAWEPGAGGTRALLDVLGERVELTVPLRAAHHAANLAAAAAAYVRAGLPLAGLAEGAAAIELSPLRGQELARHGGGVLVNDAYNANPASRSRARWPRSSSAPRAPARWPCSATWPSSAPMRRAGTPRPAAPARGSASTS